ncbi:MAG TPA: crotonase/enoyl-CoA hydratase family protein [Ramlibacter sp.]|nr:crotonase/enoyl-CoA hydratase family protein [Ramlibacter sp.]
MREVNLSVHGPVGVIEINRPEARNAINNAVAQGIANALEEVGRRDDLRVAVLTGAGGNFCAGMDLKAFLRREVVRLPGSGFAGITQARFDKPLIAAVEGYALAGGFEIALACDLIVAAADARFGLPEVKRGLVANAGALLRLPRQLPARVATELVLLGDAVPADFLMAHGLINRVTPPGGSLAAALELGTKIAANAPLSLAVSKRVMTESADWRRGEMFELQQQLTGPVFTSEDAREGALAFAEKRAPRWRGA